MSAITTNNSFISWKNENGSETSNFTSAKINFNFASHSMTGTAYMYSISINQFPYALTHREISFCHVLNAYARWKQAHREPRDVDFLFRSILNFSWAHDAIVSSITSNNGIKCAAVHGSKRGNVSANKGIMNFPKVICMKSAGGDGDGG